MRMTNSENVCDRSSQPKFLSGVVEGFYGRPWTFEQRKDLFAKMRAWDMNTYMYAPKDDAKHRGQWREPYTVEEAVKLQGLVAAAKENGIEFYYALSPGLDMTYSSAKELATLKRKLQQIASFGVTAFALLFDDIEREIGEADKEVFQTFAQAQVSVTNDVFQALNQPKFIFCPTEYCAQRAIPTVQTSKYLETIGSKLLPAIDIMWTGNRVISKTITLKSMQELQDVLRRPPLIWDNLHANDYDLRRVFLGPYSGRSTRLIPSLRGVLTNPNCEYESNFIAINTLAQWSKCSMDACKSVEDSSSCESVDSIGSTSSAARPLAEPEAVEEEIPAHLPKNTYHPRAAVQTAIELWLGEFNRTKCPDDRTSCEAVTVAPVLPVIAGGTLAPPLSSELVDTLVDAPPAPVNPSKLEPMDCNPTPPRSASPSKVDDDAARLGVDEALKIEEMQTEESPVDSDQVPLVDDPKGPLTVADVSLLVDLFYLPFEHGKQGAEFVQEFAWLKGNAHYLVTKRNKTELDEWYKRAAKFDQMTRRVNILSEKLQHIPNRCLFHDIHPYVWDIKGVISLINTHIKWIGSSKGYGKTVPPPELEPWNFRGGLTAELQRLLPLETVNDLVLYRLPDTSLSKTYTIRPYSASDEGAVYEVCAKTSLDGEDGTMEFEGYPDLYADKTIGGFIALSSELSFVVENDGRIVGYALAAQNAADFFKKTDIAWNSELKEKYPLPNGQEDQKVPSKESSTRAGTIISGFHSSSGDEWTAYPQFPSLIVMALLPEEDDGSLAKRLLACLIVALKANGSHGAHVKLLTNDKNMRLFYDRLGFQEIFRDNDQVVMGRMF